MSPVEAGLEWNVSRRSPNEIIRATYGAHNEMMDIERLTDEDLAKIQKKYGLLISPSTE